MDRSTFRNLISVVVTMYVVCTSCLPVSFAAADIERGRLRKLKTILKITFLLKL